MIITLRCIIKTLGSEWNLKYSMCQPLYSKWYLMWKRWNIIIVTVSSFVFLACLMIGLISMYVPFVPDIVTVIGIIAIWCLLLAITLLLNLFFKGLSNAAQTPTDTDEAVELSPTSISETYEDVVQSLAYISQASEQVKQTRTDIDETREQILQYSTDTDVIRMVEIIL
ncbi:hypothetical protein AVEN_59899-1 [Araneus ventricosus]|uniref:Uncharacterized protein n=1 Tax=Araneus ventricosus TaxID=182803 RepID=A0A4Y2EE83_ARAVE|nr:hypothetical protein AVEN_59899-1 [Araneus ventricosus]